jgi:hypothetical protein
VKRIGLYPPVQAGTCGRDWYRRLAVVLVETAGVGRAGYDVVDDAGSMAGKPLARHGQG